MSITNEKTMTTDSDLEYAKAELSYSIDKTLSRASELSKKRRPDYMPNSFWELDTILAEAHKKFRLLIPSDTNTISTNAFAFLNEFDSLNMKLTEQCYRVSFPPTNPEIHKEFETHLTPFLKDHPVPKWYRESIEEPTKQTSVASVIEKSKQVARRVLPRTNSIPPSSPTSPTFLTLKGKSFSW